MSKLLADLPAGTPVRANDGTDIGEVRAVYGSGEARVAEFLLVFWRKRGEEALVAADEVESVGTQGVTLSRSEGIYDDLPAFEPSVNPMLHRL